MIKTVKLLGHLGRKFGREYKFDVASPFEAVKALSSQIKGFKKYMSDGKGRDQKFRVVVGDRTINYVDEGAECTGHDISIVPVFKGSGGSLIPILSVVAGAVLIGVGVMSGFNPWLISIGAGLLIGGAMAAFMKTPGVTATSDTKSYIFDGATNTTQQGQPIPVGYGRMRVGSQVISASISVAQVPIT